MENTKIKKLNRMLFMLGTLVKRVEIKNNRITDIKFKSNIEDYSFVSQRDYYWRNYTIIR